jgi:hypothetical protein
LVQVVVTTVMLGHSLYAQPTLVLAFHTTCVKWPVTPVPTPVA